ADLASRLSDDEARRAAWEGALAIVHADGSANPAEQAFLGELRAALGFSDADVAESSRTAGALARAPLAAGAPSAVPLDELILQQAILTGALEVLPDRLANVAILPLQLRLVYQIGQRHGQKLDANQVKDLAATFGLGAAAQGLEGVAMKLIGGLAGSLLGGMFGGATRVATGAVITFSATYALGHVAEQYYAQGRRLDGADLRRLFARFEDEAKTIYPRVQQQIERQASTLNLQSLLQGFRNG
ncbi:MAG TPA: TerB family tellurite resistance protein, partial [Myxococcales bacterium]